MNIITFNGNEDLPACFTIRHKVFVIEQNVPLDLEMDGLDTQATHYLLMVDDHPAGTTRVRLINDGETAKIERVAILGAYRGQGLGKRLMHRILDDLRANQTIKSVLLAAQLPVIPFYESFGLTVDGEVFLKDGIEHRMMCLILQE